MDDSNSMLRTDALAARWLTSPGRLANMRCAGRGPRFTKIGHTVLYRLADVIAYEDQHMVGTLDQRVSA